MGVLDTIGGFENSLANWGSSFGQNLGGSLLNGLPGIGGGGGLPGLGGGGTQAQPQASSPTSLNQTATAQADPMVDASSAAQLANLLRFHQMLQQSPALASMLGYGGGGMSGYPQGLGYGGGMSGYPQGLLSSLYNSGAGMPAQGFNFGGSL